MANFRSRKPYSRPPTDGQWLHDKAPVDSGRDVTFTKRTSAATSPPAGSKLVVSGLHYEITPKDLNAIFGQVGTLISEPFIRYDRSGRSTGVATITYETSAEAAKALKQFNGLLAKGQPMEIAFDTSAPRRDPSKPTTSSLLNRIEKQPLVDRLAGDAAQNGDAQTGSKFGPIRSSRGRGTGRGRGGAGRNKAGVRPKKKPQTIEELDKELEAFMGDSAPASTAGETGKASGGQTEDVDMA